MRIGVGKKVGGFYIGASTSTKGAKKAYWSIFLFPFYLLYYICVWPFVAIYNACKKKPQTAASQTPTKHDPDGSNSPSPGDGSKKPFYKKTWFWIVIAVILLGLYGIGSKNSGEPKPQDAATPSQSSAEKAETPAAEPDPVATAPSTPDQEAQTPNDTELPPAESEEDKALQQPPEGTENIPDEPATPSGTNDAAEVKPDPMPEPAPPSTVASVWIPASGTKYHSESSCSNMEGPSEISLDEAKSMGFTACKRCKPPQ